MSRELVDSGIEWIGELPKNWELKRIGNIFEQKNQKVSDYDYRPLSVTKQGIVKQLETAAKSNDHTNRKKVCVNDFVINSRSDRKMSSGISPLEGSVSLINIVLHGNSNKIIPSFTNYLLKNYGFAEEFYRWGTGIVEDLWSTNYSKMKKILIPIPRIDEQQKIANFLDEKTIQIDSIIENTKRSMEELKKYKQSLITETVTKGLDLNVEMKDSGIEWIGKVPQQWRLGKIKNVTSKIGSGKTPRGGAETYKDSGVLFLRSQNIYNSGLSLNDATYISNEVDEEMKNSRVYPNDVLLNITGGSIGRNCIYSMNTHANVNQHVCILRCISDLVLPEFLNFYLISHCGQIATKLFQTGGNREGLNFGNIGNINIPIIPITEQKQIVSYLNKKLSNIHKLINYKESIILELDAYKKSLIYEYVTGKKEVM